MKNLKVDVLDGANSTLPIKFDEILKLEMTKKALKDKGGTLPSFLDQQKDINPR